MTGMRCDGCGELLRYKSEIVAVYEADGALRAKLVREDSPGTGQADRLGATRKFHPGCYETARATDPGLPALRAHAGSGPAGQSVR